MKNKVVKLTESQLTNLIKKVMKEATYYKPKFSRTNDWTDDETGKYKHASHIPDFNDYDEEEFDDFDEWSSKHNSDNRKQTFRGTFDNNMSDDDIRMSSKERFDSMKPIKVRSSRKK